MRRAIACNAYEFASPAVDIVSSRLYKYFHFQVIYSPRKEEKRSEEKMCLLFGETSFFIQELKLAEITTIPKVPSHVEGLDEVLEGGLPLGRTAMVYGAAGTGKTVLGVQFIYKTALAGTPGIIVSFEESADALKQNANSLGWNLAELEQLNTLAILTPQIDFQAVVSGSFTLSGLLAMLQERSRTLGARHILIDGIDAMLRLLPDASSQRNELLRFHNWFVEQGMTAIMNTKMHAKLPETPEFPFLEYAADVVIHLSVSRNDPQPSRRLQVVKYRGSGFKRSSFPYTVVPRYGITVIPISMQRVIKNSGERRVPTGHAELDRMSGGGLVKGHSLLIAGPSGVGKTLFVSLFAEAACTRGEKVLLLSFEEGVGQIVASTASAGIDLQSHIDSGNLRLITHLPETAGLETHLYHHVQELRSFSPDHVIVDSITPIGRMADQRAVFEYILRLVALCRQMGATCILTRQVASFSLEDTLKDIEFVSQLDMILSLIYIQESDAVDRALLVLKTRGSGHSNRFHRYTISDDGIRFLPLAGRRPEKETFDGQPIAEE